jgi:hypothetical protein
MKFIILSEAEMIEEVSNSVGNYQVLCCVFYGEELTAIRFESKGPAYVMDIDVEALLEGLSRDESPTVKKEDLN